MPQVASEAPVPALKPSLPNPAWLGPSSGRAPPTPFESLLADGDQAAPPPPQSPPPADKTAQTAPTDSSQPAAKSQSQDGDTSQAANTDAAPKTADAATDVPDASAAACKPANTIKTKADAGLVDQAVPGDDAKSTGDGKQAGGLTPAIHAGVVADNSAPAIVPAAGLLVAAASVAVPQTFAATAPQATATADIQAAIAAAGATKSGPTGASNASVKTSSALQAGGKPQVTEGNADTQAAANGNKQTANDLDKQVTGRPQDQIVTGNRHAAAPEAPPAVAADTQSAAPKVLAGAVQQAAQNVAPQGLVQTVANPAAPTQLTIPAAAVPLAGVAIEIAGKALAGKNRFEIRLDPPELGRIEVHLDVDRDGNTTTRLIADRSDTLDLLRRDSTGLERALQDAGLKTSDNGLQFSLRDQTMGRDPNSMPTPGAAQIVVQDDLAAADLAPRQYSRLAGLGGGIDIRV